MIVLLKELYIKISDERQKKKYIKYKHKVQREMIEELTSLPENEYEDFIKKTYKQRTSFDLDFANPETFTQKLQWLKLYGYPADYSKYVDKYAVKQYITETLGKQYIIPLISIDDKDHFYDSAEIDFDKLPKSFVIKCNHGSAYNFIVKDKDELSSSDIKKIKKTLNQWLSEQFAFKNGLEMIYKNVKPCIFIEKFIELSGCEELIDYKYFCFDGQPKVMYISNDIGKDPRTDFFDMDFNHLSIQARDPNADVTPTKPEKFDEMKKLAELLAKGTPHLRVDFYCVDSHVYVGELTFFHNSGFSPITPHEYEKLFGTWITIDQSKRDNNFKYRKQ